MPRELEEKMLPCRHYPARFNGYNLSLVRRHPRNRCKDREYFYMFTPRLVGGTICSRPALSAGLYVYASLRSAICSHDFEEVPDYEIFLKSG